MCVCMCVCPKLSTVSSCQSEAAQAQYMAPVAALWLGGMPTSITSWQMGPVRTWSLWAIKIHPPSGPPSQGGKKNLHQHHVS